MASRASPAFFHRCATSPPVHLPPPSPVSRLGPPAHRGACRLGRWRLPGRGARSLVAASSRWEPCPVPPARAPPPFSPLRDRVTRGIPPVLASPCVVFPPSVPPPPREPTSPEFARSSAVVRFPCGGSFFGRGVVGSSAVCAVCARCWSALSACPALPCARRIPRLAVARSFFCRGAVSVRSRRVQLAGLPFF